MTSPCKSLIICADDYAQNDSISEGIIALAKQKRINAVSCLVNSPSWGDVHVDLSAVKESTYIGLHLNLTDGQPLSSAWRRKYGEQFIGLPRLLQKTYLRRLDVNSVATEIRAQIDTFSENMLMEPDFIDGHQHVHQLPVIRDALLMVLGDSHLKSMAFVRNTSNGWSDLFSTNQFPKRQLITLLGGRTFRRRLKQHSIPMNRCFSGIYNFANAARYRTYFKQFLTQIRNTGLIMCHPGTESNDLSDPLYLSRHHEFNYLMSDVFLSDLEDNSFFLTQKVDP